MGSIIVPAEYALGAIQKRFSIPFRAGVHLTFEATRLQGFSGFFFVLEKGVKIPAEYWGLGMTINGADVEVVVGKAGEFYLENLRPGKYPARLFTKGKECLFEINIPESAELMVPMGEVICTIP